MSQQTKNSKARFLEGGLLLFAQTIVTKAIAFVGQLIVAKILLPEDYGLVALAYTVMSFIDVIQKVGLKEILIQKGKDFSNYANAAFWISFALGMTTFVITNAVAPFAANFYQHEGIVNILRVLSIAGIFTSLQNVPLAWLQSTMQFRKISWITALQGILQTVLTIVFAYNGLGAYSLILPFPIVRIITFIILLKVTKMPGVKAKFEMDKWQQLYKATTIMFVVSFLYAFYESGANLILGKMHSTYVVGIFYFAFMLVSQVNSVFKINLVKIYLPYLTKLESYVERKRFFLKSIKNMNFILFPAFILLSINGGVFLDFIYGHKWDDAIPVVQVLFIAYVLDISFEMSLQFVISQGYYKKVLYINLCRTLLFILAILAGALSGGALAVAISILIYIFTLTPFTIYFSLKPQNRTWSEVLQVVLLPVVASAASFGLAYLGITSFFVISNMFLQAVSISLTGLLLYVIIFIKLFPGTWTFYVNNLMYFKRNFAD